MSRTHRALASAAAYRTKVTAAADHRTAEATKMRDEANVARADTASKALRTRRDDALNGTPWPPDTFSTNFAAHIRRRPELPKIRFHDRRHTLATHLLKQGVHPKIVSERLGHSNISITGN